MWKSTTIPLLGVLSPAFALFWMAAVLEAQEPSSPAPSQAGSAEAANRTAQPCLHDPKHDQLDFWVGEWEVVTPQGQPAGSNRIEKILGGCLILENWTSVSGSGGKSMNFYHPELGKWRQLWVDGRGRVISYEAELSEGVMHFQGTNTGADGSVQESRMTLTPLPGGKVRQLIEQSADHGGTWNVWFDGTYIPKDKPSDG